MKNIWIIFILVFILTSCYNSWDVYNKTDKKIKKDIVVEADTINISDIENQPNF